MKILSKTLGRLGLALDNVNEQSQVVELDSTFKDFSFDQRLQEVIADAGYSKPTPIQVKSIPFVVEGKDLIACAQTGTGKTAAFSLPTLHKLILEMKTEKQRSHLPKVLVLVPTRELAIQVQETFDTFGSPFRINTVCIIGGVSIGMQISNLRRRSPKVIVATPGRLLDILEQGAVNLSGIQTLILDEADRMLDMGFIPDTKRIVKAIPQQRQTLMFSATISKEVNELSKQIMSNPVSVSVAAKRVSADGIEQTLYPVPHDNKRSLLLHLLENKEMNRVIIFTRTKFTASKLSDHLVREGIRSKVIHSGKSQACRQSVWNSFRSGRLRVLVATDLASRGIDVEAVSHVVNYDLPDCAETYIHRIGRTGRANKTGKAISFCSPDQKRLLFAIERHLGKPITVCKEHPFLKPLPRQQQQDSMKKEFVAEEFVFEDGENDLEVESQRSFRPRRRREFPRNNFGGERGPRERSSNRQGGGFNKRSRRREPRSSSQEHQHQPQRQSSIGSNSSRPNRKQQGWF